MSEEHLHLTDQALRMAPWIIGIIVSIVGVAIRNEWTTNKMEKALFTKDGDLRLVKIESCDNCRKQCQEGIDKAMMIQTHHMELLRKESREDIKIIHKKLDDMPQRIATLLNSFGNGK